jgi:dsDNA-specific endonuclease/ATPase MutS2
MINDNSNEIAQLIQELEQLQVRISRVNERLKELNNDDRTSKQTTKDKSTLKVGDKVEVTNKYKGRLGVRGTVIRVTSAQVVIQEEDGDEVFRKYKANVKRV